MRWLKLLLKIAAGIFAFIILLFFCAVVYVQLNKKAVLQTVTQQLNENINGTLTIGSMEPTLIRGFPDISISLKDVTLRDSLWPLHRHDLLQAKEMYVSMNAFSVLKGGARIRDINISHANIYLFTDSNGYSNTSIFRKNQDTTQKKNQARINHLSLEDVHLIFENKTKFKLFDFDIRKLKTVVDYKGAGWRADIDLKAHVRNLIFNTAKGSFLKNKNLAVDISVNYDKATQKLSIPLQNLELDNDVIKLGGQFSFDTSPATFSLRIKADDIKYKNAIALLTPSISSKINILDFKKPIDIEANIYGRTKFRDTPFVKINWQVANNTFIIPGGEIEKCSFKGSFINEKIKGDGRNDKNSLITINHMMGQWSDIDFKIDTASITNLISPVLEGKLASKFDISKLNPIINGNSFRFNKGNAQVNLSYRMGIRNNNTTQPYIFGTVQLANSSMTYLPRNLSFTNASAMVKFMGSDLFINNLHLQKGTTVLNMNGSLRNFFNLYYTAPEKILLDWHISSPQINLDEFISFLAPRKTQVIVARKDNGNVTKISNQLDKVLDASSVRMQVQVDKIIYRKFEARDLKAEVGLTNTDITLRNFKVNHADGSLQLDAHLRQQGPVNTFTLKTNVSGVNVKKFFSSFENFGQDAITDKNINGHLSANVDVIGAIRDNGSLMPNAISGKANFKFENGALVNFEPLRKISRFIFRKRNLDNISFNTIENTFDINGDKVTIHPMYIESSAINMHVEGVYAVGKTGTDIKLDIPLRNPKKDELIIDDETRHEKNMQGIVLHLKAVDGEDGKVKIKWNKKDKDAGDDTLAVQPNEPEKKRWFKRKQK